MDTLGGEQVPGRSSGVVLGDSYIVGRRIGRGAMGEVYDAQHVRLPGHFAVKLLLPELQGNQEAFARFCREAEIMSQLRHPNIVQIFDFNLAPDARPYFVMEYLEGRDLQARLRDGPLTLPAVTRIVDAVASALALAHAHGVVHRDLKPDNIMIGAFGEVMVMDWGVAQVSEMGNCSGQMANCGEQLSAVVGTRAYMPPEQAHGEVVDARADVFALGGILHFLLTGTAPDASVMRGPRALQAICRKARAGTPAARYPDVASLAADVDRFLAAEPVMALPETIADRMIRVGRKNRVAIAIVVTYLVFRYLIAMLAA